MNVGTFAGRIGRDAELRELNDDVASVFSLAVDVGTKANPRTMWVECTLWGKRGEGLNAYLLTGTKVTAHGRVELVEFTKRDGTHGAKLQVTVSEVDLHGGGKAERDAAPPPAPSQRAKPSAPSAPAKPRSAQPEFDDDLDDVPF
jgi:single-strand DNA-binding protein